MFFRNQDLRSIILTSRPLRYAFIVDPESSDISKQLKDIFQFSFRMWGGRLNTIIPLINNRINQEWWTLFKTCDPDKVITCTTLNEELIQKIHNEICPSEITYTSDRNPILAPRHCPISVLEIPRYQEQTPSYGKQERYYCIKSTEKSPQEEQQFIEVNFGYYEDINIVNESFKHVSSKNVLFSHELNIEDFINKISSNYEEKPVFPIDICETYTSKTYRPEPDHFSSSLQIIIGDSPLELIYFWNRHMYSQGDNGKDTVWFPSKFFQNKDSYEKIGKWINSNYYGRNSGNNSAYVISFSEDNLEQYSNKLKKHFPSLAIRTKKMSYDTIPNLQTYPKENTNEISESLTYSSRIVVENSSSTVPVHKPPFHCSEKKRFTTSYFAVDLYIEHNPKQFINKTHYIKIPQRHGLSFTFFGYEPIASRINGMGYPTKIVGAKENYINFSIPNIQNIFEQYRFEIPKVSNIVSVHDLKSKFHLMESEEGKELKRLIELFGDLNNLGHFLEDHFLIKFSYELSNIKNLNNEIKHKETKLRYAVNTLFKAISPKLVLSENQVEKCIEILDEKLNVFFNKPNKEYSLGQIEKLFGLLKSKSLKEERDVNFWESYKKFSDYHREQFNFYYYKKIFLQGFRQTCPFCSHEDWYPIPSNGNIQCNSCSFSYLLEIFPEFQIRINDLFAKALKKNSYIYVAWALHHLQRDSFNSSFFYLHSQDIIPTEKKEMLTDLDLIIIKDGMIGIGEVKASPSLFLKNQTLQKLEKAAILVLPNEIYLCAPSHDKWPDEVISEIRIFEEKMNNFGIKTIIYNIPPLVEWS